MRAHPLAVGPPFALADRSDDAAVPRVGKGEILVDVYSGGLNFFDVSTFGIVCPAAVEGGKGGQSSARADPPTPCLCWLHPLLSLPADTTPVPSTALSIYFSPVFRLYSRSCKLRTCTRYVGTPASSA